MWNWWNETNDDEITHGPDKIGTGSLEDKLLGCIQIWSDLTKRADSGNLSCDEIELKNFEANSILNTIGNLYLNLHNRRWAFACYFLALYKLDSISLGNCKIEFQYNTLKF